MNDGLMLGLLVAIVASCAFACGRAYEQTEAERLRLLRELDELRTRVKAKEEKSETATDARSS